LIEILIFMF